MTPRSISAITVPALLAALLGIPAPAQVESSPSDEAAELTATLSGTDEIPPGDPDGSGSASVKVDLDRTELCFELHVSGLENPTAAHIHDGARGEVGPPVVTLGAPGVDGTADGCAHLSKELLQRILAEPAGYYVNVHTAEHPGGALRGQLTE